MVVRIRSVPREARGMGAWRFFFSRDVNFESGKLKEEDLFHVPICLGCLKADMVSGGRMWVMHGRIRTHCDFHLAEL